jgi:hypothetical protein
MLRVLSIFAPTPYIFNPPIMKIPPHVVDPSTAFTNDHVDVSKGVKAVQKKKEIFHNEHWFGSLFEQIAHY